MKLFVTGISGLLGLNMALQVRERHQVGGCYYTHPVVLEGVAAQKLDLSSGEGPAPVWGHVRPDVIIHTVALTSVDACEADPELAYRLNVETAVRTAMAANAIGAKLVHISTDHLFDGAGPWRTETDTPCPQNVYARTKLQGEREALQACPDALVIRTNFFGWGTSVRESFSDWVLNALEHGQELTMFSDVFFTPILVNDLIELILDLVQHGAAGVVHVAGAERISKYDFALKLAETFGHPKDRIHDMSVGDFTFKAPRPQDMSLSSETAARYLGVRMPDVKEGLERLRSLGTDGHRVALEQALRKESRPEAARNLKE